MIKHFLHSQEKRGYSIATLFLCALLTPPLFALQESTGPNGSNVQAVHDSGYTGQGVAVGLISLGHARLTHEAFTGINPNNWHDTINPTAADPTLSNHDTSVGGIICSRGGELYPDDKGAAPGAELYSVKVSTYPNLVNGLSYLLGKCQIVVTPVEVDALTANGTSDWSLIYDYYAYKYNMIFATASGNGDSGISVMGDTYNSITTGGLIIDPNNIYRQVGTTSNSGFTADERKKPDIVAPSAHQQSPQAGSDTSWGDNPSFTSGQTSWAVPHIGGVAAVLLSYAEDEANTEPDDNKSEVIKAVIVNSAFPNILDKGGNGTVEDLESEPDWPWHQDRGYGRIDAMRAYEILSSPRITPSSSTDNSKGWSYDSAAYGQNDSYTIAGVENERLVITLTWNRRIEWNDQKFFWQAGYGIIESGELEAFLADLDLEIYDPDEIPVPLTSSNKDNLEKFDLLLSKTGDYEIKVVAKPGSESANYALAFELLPPLAADFDINYVVNLNDLDAFVPYWLETDCTSGPCLDYDLSSDNQIDLSDYSIFAEKWLTYDPRYYSP